MTRKTKIIGVTLYPQQVEYLEKLYSEGFNKSAVIRKALELHENASIGQQIDYKGGLNEKDD